MKITLDKQFVLGVDEEHEFFIKQLMMESIINELHSESKMISHGGYYKKWVGVRKQKYDYPLLYRDYRRG